ncbi:MAG TPA: hypothetical protein VK737_03310 [Opitutales bacterium]|nr:hypothetical protein [Opitutales bacterium]
MVGSQPPPGPGQTGYNAGNYSTWIQSNYAPVNLGQLKNFAVQGQAYLANQLGSIGGADPDIGNLVAAFDTDPAKNYEPANLGQVKALAKMFYDRLLQVGFDPKPGINFHLTGNGNSTIWTTNYPWPAQPSALGQTGYNATTYDTWVAQNYQPANLGQLKMIFSFDLGNFTPAANLSVAGDGIFDWWKVLNGLSPFAGNLDGHYDFGDGLTDLQQFQRDMNLYNGTVTGNLVGNVSGFQSSYTSSSTSFATVPADMEVGGSLDFPRIAPLRYALIDLGNGTAVDIGSDGEVLFATGDIAGDEADVDKLWADGMFTDALTTDGEGTYYEWQKIADDGTVMGYTPYDIDFISGAVVWDGDPDDPAETLADAADLSSFAPDNTTLEPYNVYTVPSKLIFERSDDIYYFALYDGEDNSYYQCLHWASDDSVTPEGPAILMQGNATPAANATITVPLGADAANDTLELHFSNFTYNTDYDYDEDTGNYDIPDGSHLASYQANFTVCSGNTHLVVKNLGTIDDGYGDGGPIEKMGFPSDGDRQFGNLTHPYLLDQGYNGTAETLDYLSGNVSEAANLTVSANNSTTLQLAQIMPDGTGLTQPWSGNGSLVFNGYELAQTDMLGASVFNPDLTLNLSALGINATFGNATLNLYGLSPNGVVLGTLFDTDYEEDSVPRVVVGIQASLAVDNNRDGNISFDVDDQTTATKPFRFWLNDDDGSGNTSGDDVPQGTGNGNAFNESGDTGAFCVNGAKDLVNYFPVYLIIGKIVQEFPPSANYTYKLSQTDGAVNILYTNLTLASAFDYLRNSTVLTGNSGFGDDSGYGSPDYVCMQGVTSATKHPIGNISSGGYTLSGNFVSNITTNTTTSWGVILVDGRATTNNPLVLTVWNGSTMVTEPITLSLNIGNIEDMYRHINLRPGTIGGDGTYTSDTDNNTTDLGLTSNTSSPKNFPDMAGSNWVFFIHGYNVGGNASRGWSAEVFKGLYWSHSKAKFVGVSWFGDPYDTGTAIPNYQSAVRNAFATAPRLANIVNSPTFSGNKTFIAHSLGSMVVASAMEDYGMNINQACLVDAAIASEAFDGNADTDIYNMALPSWLNVSGNAATAKYDPNLWASNWWNGSFNGTSDQRQYLTWQNRFNGQNGFITSNSTTASKIYNFYSSTENVLALNPNTPSSTMLMTIYYEVVTLGENNGDFAWVVQEKTKGNQIPIPGIVYQGSTYGGWGFNVIDSYWSSANTTSANSTELAHAQSSPFFNNGYQSNPFGGYLADCPSVYFDLLNSGTGTFTAGNTRDRAQFLAETIPALSLPMGANFVSTLSEFGTRNFNMPDLYVPDPSIWPNSTTGSVPNWFHSNMREVAYPYLYPFYDKLVNISN